MPELPEVETVRMGLTAAMEGSRIKRVELKRPDLRFPFPARFEERLEGRRVVSLARRAKYLLLHLDDQQTLLAHLGMSGSFHIIEAEARHVPGEFHHERGKLERHDHVTFTLDGPTGETRRVIYNDPRRFGFMDLIEPNGLEGNRFLKGLGIEPTGNRLSGEVISGLFEGRAMPLKSALLDQRLIAGLGNIYVCEALWRAGLSPMRPAGTVAGTDRAGQLADDIRAVIAEAILAGGSSLRDYVHADGTLGYFQHSFAVYDREGGACRKPGCAGTIQRQAQGGRSTFFCASCQT